MMSRVLPWLSALALLISAASPVAAHDGELHDGGEEQGWPGSARGQEMARAFLADSQPAQELAAQSGTSCIGGFAGGYPCSNVDLLSFLPLADIGGGKGNDIWGWTDPTTGREYAIMGRSTGTAFVDITVPQSPVYVGNLPTSSAFSSTWRDIKVYANHAFIVSEATNHGMQVFDLTRLRNVTSPPVTYSADARYTGLATAHNIAINEKSGFAYAVGTKTCSGGLHIIDIRTPTNPTGAGCFSADGYTHDVQCVNYAGPDTTRTGRELCFASNEDTLTIVDVTTKSAPVRLARLPYVGADYTHQGWLTDDQRYFLIDDEGDEGKGINTRTYVFDVANPAAPVHIGTYVGTNPAIDHNQYIVGNHAYQANYRSGLRILDISGVATPSLSEVAYFDIYPADNLPQFNGAWSVYPFFTSGTVVLSGIEQGLFVLRPNLGPPDAPPSVTITQPTAGATVSGTVTVAANASDNDAVTGVEFFVDGASIGLGTDTTDGWSIAWDTTLGNNGSRALTATATDTRGQTSSHSINVTVNNPQPPATMHVGDLDATKQLKGKSGRWQATVTVTVHDGSEKPLGGVTVNGAFTGSTTASVSGTTATDGTVIFSTGALSGGSVTFTVSSLLGTLTYSAANHDPDGDSNGTTITITKT